MDTLRKKNEKDLRKLIAELREKRTRARLNRVMGTPVDLETKEHKRELAQALSILKERA